ncbi:hypothetical protein [Treponema sp.]|uniref:hypothetical protein n=1 Tax=Treponema sp. TaxID=166 RepID=UPI00298E75F9|nr:hypothetical protein [Treponema sp.]MCR5612755.1 hypothetical protein [Treponema sp.]
MTDLQWNIFCTFRNSFKQKCREWSEFSKELIPLQKAACAADTPPYPIETPVVYNTALDDLTKDSEIKLIVIGDNPGKSEQLASNQKYLVGQAGKIAQGFFERNPDLGVDFRKNAIILNKTPVHSAKTKHLNYIDRALKEAESKAHDLILESQVWMAKETALLHKLLVQAALHADGPELWLVGYAELKKGGIFIPYKEALKSTYCGAAAAMDAGTATCDDFWDKVFVFQHFSMNRFLIDLKQFRDQNPELSLSQAIAKTGTIHKNEIF